MEGYNYKEEIKDYMKNIYRKYDTANTGELKGEALKMIMKDYKITNENKCATYRNFEEVYFSKSEKEKFFEFFDNILSLTEFVQTKKSISFSVNKNEETVQESKTKLLLKWLFNHEVKTTLLKDLLSQYDNALDPLFLLLKISSVNPSSTKNQIENIMKLVFILIKAKDPNFSSNFITLEYTLGENCVTVKINYQHPSIKILEDIFKIATRKMKHLKGDLTLNVELKHSFGDLLNHSEEDTIRTLLDGSKLSLNLLTNFFSAWAEIYSSMEVPFQNQMLLNFLSILDFNGDFNLKMGKYEDKLFWSKLPAFNLFSADNVYVKTVIQQVCEFKVTYPLTKKVLELIEGLTGEIQVYLNSPIGLFNLKAESSGLMEIWELLQMIHYQK